MRRGEMRLSIMRPLVFYAAFWIMFVMFMNQLGLWGNISGINVPPIATPQVSQESPKVVTQDFMKITGYNLEKDLLSFYVYAGTVEENVFITVYVDGYPIRSFALPPYYEYVQPVTIRLESGTHALSVKKIKDNNVLEQINWEVTIP